MKVAISAIGKLENKYIKEWVDYNRLIGIDHIFLYDNNDPWGEYFNDVLQNDIDSGFISLIDYRGKKICQCESYQETLEKYYKEYDWICFIDCDEFITFTKAKNIKEYLSDECFKSFDIIKLNFLAYGDNDLLDNESKSAINTFKNPLPFDHKGPLQFPNNCHSKCIIKCNSFNPKLKNIKWCLSKNVNGRNGDPHIPIIAENIRFCNNNGDETKGFAISNINYDKALIRHYSTKTIKEFILTKFRRGFPDQICNYKASDLISNICTFFSFNRATNEKIEVVKKLTEELYEKNNDLVISEARGRIGNTLFTIAAGAYYAKENNKRFKLYVNYKDAQYVKYLTQENVKVPVHYTDWIMGEKPLNNFEVIKDTKEIGNAYIDCYEKNSTTYNKLPDNLGNVNVFIHGFRQSPKYFDRKWCKDIFIPSKEILDTIAIYIKDNFNLNTLEDIVCINVRRGDYTNPANSWIMYVNPIEWYKKIINLYSEQQKFLIDSDDIKWCKESFSDIRTKMYFFDYQEDNKDFIDLYVQTLCKDNIISNSTFSWWGAYLNIHKDRKVYYHSPWYLNSNTDNDIIPENDNWIDIQ